MRPTFSASRPGRPATCSAKAWDHVNRQVATTVLVIEDEPIIALDIAGIVRDLGHTVVGIAASQAEAVAMARAKRPGLVLADIHLGEGGSGLSAVNEILKSIDVPVIFVTAYPERLLTGRAAGADLPGHEAVRAGYAEGDDLPGLVAGAAGRRGGAGDLIHPQPAACPGCFRQ